MSHSVPRSTVSPFTTSQITLGWERKFYALDFLQENLRHLILREW